ncbi:hypothetical protein [Streptomyces sp. NPDC018693]|uniref:hypothetical protein n=1 Tax=unclassified Streptomyces TaxID=2593676 RepID=UPI00379C3FD9
MAMKRLATVAAAALLLVACGGGGDDFARESRESQKPSDVRKDGHFLFTLLSLRCGIAEVTGSHSGAAPDGQFCAVRLRVDNPDPNFHTYVAGKQRLEGVSGRRGQPDSFAMAVRRQHEEVQIGGHALIEVELWYDIPRDADVTGLRVFGDRDPAGFMSSEVVDHAPNGVVLPMKPVTERDG